MSACKKCEKELKKTNIVLNIEKDSVAAQNGLLEGDVFIAIDEKSVNNKDDIAAVIKNKEKAKVDISHNGEVRTINVDKISEFIKGINFDKKDEKNNKATNTVFSIEKESVAAKNGLEEGDVLIAIDDKSINSRDDIEAIIKDKEKAKITILHEKQTRTISVKNIAEFLGYVEFADEEICSSCGAKQKSTAKKWFLILQLLLLLVVMGIFLIYQKKNSGDENKTVYTPPPKPNTEEEQKPIPTPLPPELEIILQEDTDNPEQSTINNEERVPENKVEENPRKRGRSGRRDAPPTSVADSSKNDSDIKDTKIPDQNMGDSNYQLKAKIYFRYGSFLDFDNMSLSLEKRLAIKIDVEKIGEYKHIMRGINDLIKKIPEDKRRDSFFYVNGYTDTTLFNKKPEISERSEKFNQELSEKRAETIKTLLCSENFNVSPDKVVTKGFGYSKNADITGNFPEYRRVEILVYYED